MTMRTWLQQIPLNDPLERQQASLFQAMLLVIIGGAIIGLPLSVATSNTLVNSIVSYLLLLIVMPLALVLLRRGAFNMSVALATVGLFATISGSMLFAGLGVSGVTLISYTIPIAMAGLLLGRRALWLMTAATIIVAATVALLTESADTQSQIGVVATYALVIGVLSLILDRFGTTLHAALQTAQTRELELEKLRDSLEATVAERTGSLQQALADVEQRESRLAQTLAELHETEAAVRELTAPVIPVLPGVLVAPLIGAIDTGRASALAANILSTIEREHARYVVFDITGVPLVDTHVAQALLRTADAARLLGAAVLLVGVRPEVAQTLVALNVDLGTLEVHPNLQEAIEAMLLRTHGGALRS